MAQRLINGLTNGDGCTLFIAILPGERELVSLIPHKEILFAFSPLLQVSGVCITKLPALPMPSSVLIQRQVMVAAMFCLSVCKGGKNSHTALASGSCLERGMPETQDRSEPTQSEDEELARSVFPPSSEFTL